MKIKVEKDKVLTLEQFADEHNLTLKVVERSRNMVESYSLERYYCAFESVDVVDGQMLVGLFGNGSKKEEAVKDYIPKISGKKIKLPNGKYAFVPTLDLDTIPVIP